MEAKLKVLTASLDFYIQLRLQHQAVFAEGDAFGHFLFMFVAHFQLLPHFHCFLLSLIPKLFKNSHGIYHEI